MASERREEREKKISITLPERQRAFHLRLLSLSLLLPIASAYLAHCVQETGDLAFSLSLSSRIQRKKTSERACMCERRQAQQRASERAPGIRVKVGMQAVYRSWCERQDQRRRSSSCCCSFCFCNSSRKSVLSISSSSSRWKQVQAESIFAFTLAYLSTCGRSFVWRGKGGEITRKGYVRR